MSTGSATTVVTGGVALLERAMGYTLGCLLLVTPEARSGSTPCREWDLRALLVHLDESLHLLHQAIAVGHVDEVTIGYGDPHADPVASLRNRAGRMIGAWANARATANISIADRELSPGIVAAAGAVEVAVHGWDVARACAADKPLPRALAEELLELSQLLVCEADRPARFAPRVALSLQCDSPSDALVAFLGRRPR